MSRTGPPHYHQGSSNICHCAYSDVYHHTSAPYVYPNAPVSQPHARPRPVAGHPSEYGPAVRRVPKPKPTNKIAKTREMKFDEDSWQWYFETKEAPGVRWLETVRHIEDLPQAKDSDFVAMLNEYYLCGHVIDQPDQDKLPVLPGGPGKAWRYKRAPPPPPAEKQHAPQAPQHPPAQAQYGAWVEPIHHHRPPAAPVYASGAAHPVSVRMPSGVPSPDGWRMYSNTPPHEFSPAQEGYPSQRLGPLPGAPGPRRYVDASAHPRRYDDAPSYPRHYEQAPGYSRHYDEASLHSRHRNGALAGAGAESDEGSDEYDEEEDYDGATTSGYEDPRARAYIPPPSPKSRKRAQKLRERGYRVMDPHNNVELDALEAHANALKLHETQTKHGRSASAPSVIPPTSSQEKIEIHRLLQTRSTLGMSRMPDLVFDLRYDPRHAFDRTTAGSDENDYWAGGLNRQSGSSSKRRGRGRLDLTTAPAFQPGQKFVRLVIRHPFNGRGGDWVEDVDDAQYLTVMDVLRIVSEMVHRNIDQKLDWDPLSEFDKSFVYEAYLNRPCPDEEATGRRLHLFCEKYMFGGIEQLPPKAKGTTAEGPSFLIKLIKNSKHKRYDKLAGFRIPNGKRRKWSGRSDTTYPYLTEDTASSRRTER